MITVKKQYFWAIEVLGDNRDNQSMASMFTATSDLDYYGTAPWAPEEVDEIPTAASEAAAAELLEAIMAAEDEDARAAAETIAAAAGLPGDMIDNAVDRWAYSRKYSEREPSDFDDSRD